MSRNITPIFMKNCVKALREDYRLIWAVLQTSREAYGNVLRKNTDLIFNRPKTPKTITNQSLSARAWILKYYPNVYKAFVDGKTDEEILLTWIRE